MKKRVCLIFLCIIPFVALHAEGSLYWNLGTIHLDFFPSYTENGVDGYISFLDFTWYQRYTGWEVSTSLAKIQANQEIEDYLCLFPFELGYSIPFTREWLRPVVSFLAVELGMGETGLIPYAKAGLRIRISKPISLHYTPNAALETSFDTNRVFHVSFSLDAGIIAYLFAKSQAESLSENERYDYEKARRLH